MAGNAAVRRGVAAGLRLVARSAPSSCSHALCGFFCARICVCVVPEYPDGKRIRFHWAIEQERMVVSSGASSSLLPRPHADPVHGVEQRCSLHDRRRFERVVLFETWQCYDDIKSTWVVDWHCHAQMPPHSPTHPIINHHAIFMPIKHCLHKCQPIVQALQAATTAWAAFIAFSFLVWAARWLASVPLRSADFAARPGGSAASAVSSPLLSLQHSQLRQPPTLQCAALVGLVPPQQSAAESSFHADARARLARRVADRGLFSRAFILAHAVLVYGLPVLGRTVELLLRWAALALLAIAGATALHFVVWLVDSPCTEFTGLTLLYAVTIWSACGSVLLATLLHVQQPSVIANLQQA